MSPPRQLLRWLIGLCGIELGLSLLLDPYWRYPVLDNKGCPAADTLFYLQGEDRFRCAAKCHATSGCVGLLFKSSPGMECWGCSLCMPKPADMPDQVGTKFSTTRDWVVFGDRHPLLKEQFDKSSSHGHDGQYNAWQANMHLPYSPYGTTIWGSAVADTDQWVQVDFRHAQSITEVVTMGNNHHRYPHRVEQYRVLYSDDCLNFQYVNNPTTGQPMLFPGNTDYTSAVWNFLPRVVTARCFRINPTQWNTRIDLRFDMVGCVRYK